MLTISSFKREQIDQLNKLMKSTNNIQILLELKEDVSKLHNDVMECVAEITEMQNGLSDVLASVTEIIDYGNLLLGTLRDNICTDSLNQHDPSVGVYPVTNLKYWVENEAKDHDGVCVLEVTEDTVTIECEGYFFEIFENGDKDNGFHWDIRHSNSDKTYD